MAELISVIVTTYNRADALEAVLRSLARQTDQDFEVVVADDGSTAATTQLIDAWKAKVGHRLDHVWHADRGFRAAEIRNRAITIYKGNYDEYVRMGRSQLKLKDTTGAIASYEKANSLDSASVEVAGELAAIFVAQRKFQKAAEQYERKLKVEPTNSSALYYGGFSYSMIERFDEAKQLYKRFVELRPAYPQGRMALARMYVAEDSVELGKKQYMLTKALIDSLMANDTSTVKKEDKYSQTLIDIYQALGAIEYGNKDFLSAVDYMEKAVSYESKDGKKKSASLHLFLAQMYNVARSVKTITPERSQEFKEKAIREYELVLKLDPKNIAAKKELGQLTGN